MDNQYVSTVDSISGQPFYFLASDPSVKTWTKPDSVLHNPQQREMLSPPSRTAQAHPALSRVVADVSVASVPSPRTPQPSFTELRQDVESDQEEVDWKEVQEKVRKISSTVQKNCVEALVDLFRQKKLTYQKDGTDCTSKQVVLAFLRKYHGLDVLDIRTVNNVLEKIAHAVSGGAANPVTVAGQKSLEEKAKGKSKKKGSKLGNSFLDQVMHKATFTAGVKAFNQRYFLRMSSTAAEDLEKSDFAPTLHPTVSKQEPGTSEDKACPTSESPRFIRTKSVLPSFSRERPMADLEYSLLSPPPG